MAFCIKQVGYLLILWSIKAIIKPLLRLLFDQKKVAFKNALIMQY